MVNNKKAEISGTAKTVVYGLVTIMVILTIARYMLPEVVHSANNLTRTADGNASSSLVGAPLLSLFSGSGLIVLLVMIALFIAVVGYIKFKGGK